MNDLITVEVKEIGSESVQAVSARELHTQLGVKKQFTDWIKVYTKKFVINHDFTPIRVSLDNGHVHEDYLLSVDMAKHVAMMSNTSRSREVRQYFIECEKKLKESAKPKLQSEILLEHALLLVKVEKEQIALAERQRIVECKIEDFANGAEHFSITAYNKLFRGGYQISNGEANKTGRELSCLAKNQGIDLGKAPHPVWGTVNTYPKALLDAYYRNEFVHH